MPLILSSPAFSDGRAIPERYTRDGENVSPPLKWSGVPDGTKSVVLVVEDPEAPSGTFGHWAVFNIAPDVDGLPEAEGGKPGPEALRQGKNDFGNAYYDGPEPPVGHGVHHYHFRLAALDVSSLGTPGQLGVRRIWEEAQSICWSKRNWWELTNAAGEPPLTASFRIFAARRSFSNTRWV